MIQNLTSFVVGLIFAIGLGVAGMTQPQKILGFLNINGQWDPTMLFVMASAVSVHILTYWAIKKRAQPLFDLHWHIPTNTLVNARLIFGAIIFGAGWGLAGYCPGPAIVSTVTGHSAPIVFTLSMLTGMLIFKVSESKISNWLK